MKPRRLYTAKVIGFVVLLVTIVSVPFVVWGDEFVAPLLAAQEHRTLGLVALAIALLAADSIAPVPATLVIMFLAAKAGVIAGVIGGTLGLSAGVLAASWFGRAAVGRIAPRFFPEAELTRLRTGLQRNLALTLACWRSVPVLAETSVILAAAAGVPMGRIFKVTLLPNFVIALIYSVAADDSFLNACLAFGVTLFASLALWRWSAGRPQKPAADLRD
jgi:uncharacterized membrane protein YdjX (TVP38/TMEM64 family)